MARRPPTWPALRDGLLFFAGLAGIGYELKTVPHPDPTVLLLLGTMCGLPAFLQRDAKAEKDKPAAEEPADGD